MKLGFIGTGTITTAVIEGLLKSKAGLGQINISLRSKKNSSKLRRKSKKIRAGIIHPLYEQSHIKHVGIFNQLEDQMCTWVPGNSDSPDRLDALVWALTELFIKETQTEEIENTFW